VRKISLIIPVYGQAALLQKALVSLCKNLENASNRHLLAEILILNDKPEDKEVQAVLENWNRTVEIPIYSSSNPEHLGFVGTINRGFKLAHSENDILIVNSDVEFFDYWLDGFASTVDQLESRDINWASITPCTNAGTIATVPEMNKEYSTYSNLCSKETLADLCRQLFSNSSPREIPVGVGFAMLMSRAALNAVGEFSVKYSPGYGEEVDWCLRARELGFKNFLAPAVFVHHAGGGSFSKEKEKLCQEHQKMLEEEYPFYRSLLQSHSTNPESHFVNDRLRPYANFLSLSRSSKIMIHALHSNPFSSVGGTEKYLLETCDYLLNKRSISSLIIFPRAAGNLSEVAAYIDGELFASLSVTSLLNLLTDLQRMNLVCFESFTLQHAMHWQTNNLTELVDGMTKLVAITNVFVHDFYPICKQYNLLYNDDFYCGAPVEPELGACETCTHGKGVKAQRSYFSELLSKFNRVVLPSESARNLFLSIFPSLANRSFVVPHMLIGTENKIANRTRAEKPRIIFLGNTLHTKGINHYAKLVEHFGNKFNWTAIGISNHFPDSEYVDHMYYNFHERSDITEVLASFESSYLFLGSIWPETFSFTMYEALQAGMPILAFENGGNIADTVKKLCVGKVFADNSALSQYLSLDNESIKQDIEHQSKQFSVRFNTDVLVTLYTQLDLDSRAILNLACQA